MAQSQDGAQAIAQRVHEIGMRTAFRAELGPITRCFAAAGRSRTLRLLSSCPRREALGAGQFTVNVPSRELAAAVSHYGTISGRDQDKFKEAQLTPIPSQQVRPPIIEECVVHYECRTLHRNAVVPEALVQAILDDAYPAGDFHRVYFGEIVAVCADEDAGQRLSETDRGVFPISRP